METLLKNYYNLNYDYIKKSKDEVRVIYRKDVFVLKQISKEKKDKINIYNDSFYKIMTNIYNDYFTLYDGNIFILFQIDNRIPFDEKELLNNEKMEKYISNLNWLDLWIIKTDYTEKVLQDELDKTVHDTKDYYLGLAEYAISYLQKNVRLLNNKKIIECRYRINEKEYRYPDNIINDCAERDIAEYIKYLIFEKGEEKKIIVDYLDQVYNKKFDMKLIYARIIFPTYYFDLIEKKEENITEKIYNLIRKKEKFEEIINIYLNKFIKK